MLVPVSSPYPRTPFCVERKKKTPHSSRNSSPAVPLIDSFALSDHIVNSPLGRYDGDVYVHYFNQVRASNPTPKVHPYFERLIKPLFERTDEDEDNGEVDAKMGFSEEFEELKKEREATIAANGKNKH